MCDPVTIGVALAVTAVVSTGANIVAQSQNAKVQAKAIRNQQAVMADEAQDKATGELFEQMRATRREQARIRAAAGEAGLSTTSGNIEALLNDSAMQGELGQDRTLANLESRHRANTADAASQMSQISSPTALGAGLQLGASAVQGWAGVSQAKIKAGG